MEIISLLIPMAIVLGALFLGGFIWMTMSGQYDDLDTPGHRMLLDNDKEDNNNNQTQEGEV
jgi:cbb3-type cytochrome oxidase maturation protein